MLCKLIITIQFAKIKFNQIKLNRNGTNFLVKFVGWLHTGSSSLFAECIHSLADTANQLILAFGLHQSLKTPNSEHP